MSVRIMAFAVLGVAAGMAALAGCSAGSAPAAGAPVGGAAILASAGTGAAAVISSASPAPAGFWTPQRLAAAKEWQAEPLAPGSASPSASGEPTPSRVALRDVKTLHIGTIFEHDSSGNHFCTASVVDSPAGNVIVTAAHCINGGRGGANKSDIAFVPGYAHGSAPFGEWAPQRYVLDPRWVSDHDEHYDVAFVVLKEHEGKNIQKVLGANTIAFNSGYRHYVRVTGYPSNADAPISCDNWTSEADGYLEFGCGGYYSGTSGSPWETGIHGCTGTVVGILGGYQEGGNTADVSYSAYLGDDIRKLYRDATGT